MFFEKLISLLLVFLLNTGYTFAQTDDLELMLNTPAATASIELQVVSGGNVSFQVNSISDYTQGVIAASAPVFGVNATVNFRVTLSATSLVNAWGYSLDANNFGYRVHSIGTFKAGQNFHLLGEEENPSRIKLLGEEAEIISSFAQGNAGNSKKNKFELIFELGTAAVRAESGLPSLLEQKIHIGSYSSIVTILALSIP